MSTGAKGHWMRRLAATSAVGVTLATACDLVNPADSEPYEPSRLPVGELTIGVWLPAGLGEFRFDQGDQQLLADLDINQLEWLQRAEVDGSTAEQIAMEFCNRHGLRMPVYYEAAGFSPYDKLHNWATQREPDDTFDDEVRRRVVGLKTQWESAAGFGGYLIGHEDYSRSFHNALSRTVEILHQEDSLRPAVTVGNIDSYSNVGGFLDAFFVEGSAVANVFQHEHYVFRQGIPEIGRSLEKQLSALVEGYDRVARKLQSRNGRWHAIIQVHSESRDGLGLNGPYYRKPNAAELGAQVGLALSRGASGIVYFLYSSGVELVRNGEGEVIQERVYEGLVTEQGDPTDAYHAAKLLNGQLQALSAVLEDLHFHGGYAGGDLPANDLIRTAKGGIDVGLFGTPSTPTHALIVNGRSNASLVATIVLYAPHARDAVTDAEMQISDSAVSLPLAAGEFRLLSLVDPEATPGE